MALPPAFLEELRSRLSVSEIVGKRLRLTRAGREYKACCPFHNEKTPSFYINDDKQFFYCFGCGAHGDIIGFTMRHDRLSFPETIEQLASLAGLEVPRAAPADRDRYAREKRLYQVLERATAFFAEQLFLPAGGAALSYLRGRGLSDDGIRRFSLGFAPNDGQLIIRKLLKEDFNLDELIETGLVKKSEERNENFSFFRNRVIFPVGDSRGRTVAFGGRVMGDGEPKYLNSPDHALFHKGRLLYGLSRARAALSQNQPLIVVEGYMDVIALVEAGYTGAVAPLGTALTEDQLMVLWKLLPPADARDPGRDYSPILCFDGDNAGLRAALRVVERALPLLTTSQTIRIATMPQGQDPDDLIRQAGKPAMDAVLKQAKPMIEMIWETSLTGRRLQTPEDRGAFIGALKQKVARIANESLRKLYQDDIQKRLAVALNWGGSFDPADRSSKRGFAPYNRGDKFSARGTNGYSGTFVAVSRNPPPDPRRQMERGLLAVMINHPDLFSEFEEEFAQMAFSVLEYEALKQQVTAILTLDSPETLDAAGLYRHLSTDGSSWRAALAHVRSEATYVHFGFARADRPLDEAREGWQALCKKMLGEQLKADLESARQDHRQDPTEERYMRLMALREQLEQHSREDEDNGFTETDVPQSKIQEN